MIRRPAGGRAPREGLTLVLTVPPSRRPWVVRSVVGGCAVVVAALWTLLLAGALDGTWAEGTWVNALVIPVLNLGYGVWAAGHGVWAAGHGRVVVEGDDLVVRPGRVISHRYRLRDVVGAASTSRWRGATLRLRDGRRLTLSDLSGQDLRRLVAELPAADR